MKIFDCFMYFDEDLVLDIRLNTLDKYVDFFVIIESKYNHKGETKKLNFDINKYKDFKDKIIYLIQDTEPQGIEVVNNDDLENIKNKKYILNSIKRENTQRNYINYGLNLAEKDDWIIISDLDEIPKLNKFNLKDSKEKFIFFKQEMIYYKLNLKYENFLWVGSKACKKKDLISPQWLRNIKDRNYPWWRFDILFSKNKFSNIMFVEDGGWHFSYIKTAKEIEYKLKSYLHHREYDLNPLGIDGIEKMMNEKKAIYNLKHDQRSLAKIGGGEKLKKIDINKLPSYVKENKEKLKDWLEN